MVDRIRLSWLVRLMVVLLIPCSSPAQWVREGEIPAENVNAIRVVGESLVAATDRGVFVSDDWGSTWEPSSVGLIDSAVWDVVVRGDDLIAATHSSGAFVWDDVGESWNPMSSGLPMRIVGGTDLSTVEIDGMVYIGTGGGVFVSTDDGASWDPFSFGLPAYRHVEDLAARGDTLYAAIFNTGVYSIGKGDKEWREMKAGLPSGRFEPDVGRLVAVGDSLLAVTDSGILRFNFDNNIWERIDSGSADVQGHSLISHEDALLAGAAGGLIRSDDGGDHWVAWGSGIPESASVEHLLSAETMLVAVTHDSGMYTSNDGGRTWTEVTGGSPLSEDGWVESLAVLGDLIIVRTDEGVFVSGLEGGGWTETDLSGPGEWEVMDVTSIEDRVFAGDYYGGVVPSTGSGTEWPCPGDQDHLPDDQVLALGSVGGRLIASTLNEGVLTSSDGGKTWKSGNAGLWTFEVNVFWTSGNDIYAGGWEGIFVSRDSGQSWTEVAAHIRGLNGTDVVSIESVGGRLFALTDRGLYRLDDQGSAWIPVDSPIEVGTAWYGSFLQYEKGVLFAFIGNRLLLTSDLGLTWEEAESDSGFDASRLRAIGSNGADFFAGTRDGVFVSSDGTSWTAMNSGLPEPVAVSDLVRFGESLLAYTDEGVFSLDPDHDGWIEVNTDVEGELSDSIVAVGTDMFIDTWEGLRRSTDEGESWSAVGRGLGDSPSIHSITALGPDLFVGSEYGVFRSTNRGESFERVLVGPHQDWLAGLEVIASNLFVACEDGVFRSSDRGESWSPVIAGMPVDVNVRSFAQHGSTLYAGTDKGVIVSKDTGDTWSAVPAELPTQMTVRALATDGHYLYAGGAEGVYLSVDGGAGWQPVHSGLPVGQVYGGVMALLILDSNVFAGTGSGLYRSSVGGGSWEDVADTADFRAFHVADGRVFASSSFGVYLSEDRGETWRPVGCGFRPDTYGDLATIGNDLILGTDFEYFKLDPERREWRPFHSVRMTSVTLASLAESGGDLFASTWQRGIFTMRDGADEWVGSNTGIPYTIVEVVFPFDEDLFADVYEHGIYRSTDRGETWKKSDFGLPECCWGSDLMGGENALFANYGDRIFRSTDHGESWIGLDTAWPESSHVGHLVEVESCLITATGSGIFRSRDGGANWEDLNAELPSGANAQTLTVVGPDVIAALDRGVVWRLPAACD